jgi:hypothetical protein
MLVYIDNCTISIALHREAKKTNFIVVGVIRSGIEPMNYRTGGEHANLYLTYAVTH